MQFLNERYFMLSGVDEPFESATVEIHVFMFLLAYIFFSFSGHSTRKWNIIMGISPSYELRQTTTLENHNNVLIEVFISYKKKRGSKCSVTGFRHNFLFITFFASKHEKFDWRSWNEIIVPLTFMCVIFLLHLLLVY